MEDDAYTSGLGEGHYAATSSKAEPRSGPNHRRGERSDLVKTWMMRNDKNATDPSKSRDLKAQYAESLKIRKEDFWATMKTYALRSKEGMLPDFEQIIHHMKDDSRMDLADLKMGDTALEYWWQLDADKKHYRPVTDNLKNFKPSSGLLHHFYNIFIYNPTTCDELFAHSNRLGSHRWKHSPNDLLQIIEKEDPFRSMREPKALLVLPKRNPALHGTYSLSKKLNGNYIYIRPQRAPVPVDDTRASVEVNDVQVHIPIERMLNYSTVENALILYCKEEKRNGEASDASYRSVPMRLKIPHSQARPIESTIGSLRDQSFETSEAVIYPVRDLMPPFLIADELDYGAVWSGVFSPFARPSVSVEELAVHFPNLAQEVIKYMFCIGDGEAGSGGVNITTTHSNQQIEAEAYIRLMTWFSAFEHGFGPDDCNLLGLWQSLSNDRMPFSILSKSEAMQTNRDIGAYCLRLGTSKIGYLVFEVLVGEKQVLCCRAKVSFLRPEISPHQLHPPATVVYELEGADGGVICSDQNSLRRAILAKVRELCPLPPPHHLHSYTKGHVHVRPQMSPSAHQPSVPVAPAPHPHKRKRDDTVTPPELAGFDHVAEAVDEDAPPPPAPLDPSGTTMQMWGQHFAMPDFTRGNSLNPNLAYPHLGVMAPPYATSAALCYPMAPPDHSVPPPPPNLGSTISDQEGPVMPVPVYPADEMVGRQHSIGALSDLLMGDFELSMDGEGIDRGVSVGNLEDVDDYDEGQQDGQEQGEGQEEYEG